MGFNIHFILKTFDVISHFKGGYRTFSKAGFNLDMFSRLVWGVQN